jgi:hypothetical protein
MESIFIKSSSNPDKVIEYNDIHYFYWRIEIGFPEIKIMGLKIPLPFPLKFRDFEPAKHISVNNNEIILSRFHYRILTCFNRLKLKNDKPILDFSFGSHTPFAVTDFYERPHLGTDEKWMDLWENDDVNAYEILIALFKAILNKTVKVDTSFDNIKTYDLIEGKVPECALLDPREMYAVVWFGKVPTEDEFDQIGYSIE